MKHARPSFAGRRRFIAGTLAVGAAAVVGWPRFVFAADASGTPVRIGIIGSGRIGGTLGELWVAAGHPVMFSSLDLEQDKQLAARVGHGARAGTPAEAAAFGDVILVSVPYSAVPQIGRDNAASLKGKVVLDTSNPVQARDGDMAAVAREKGAGIASQEYLQGARLVRAFNSVGFNALKAGAGRAGEKIGIPLAADDADALAVAKRLVEEAGFEPVVVGGLSKSKSFDVGSPVFGKGLPASELRKALGVSG